ncbi:WW domain binding protein 1-like [Mytilus californianus]|uniref:WW domain binding protein 1-like n=1 Tax=Mytilus californianus TaxID=6549 RepID=UPI0022453B30|nr:WW domain binding protein 1-like [Mytilus californianus]
MELSWILKGMCLSLMTRFAQGVTFCPRETCYDNDYYCCDGWCCQNYSVYRVWWFWCLWVVVFLLIVSCVICIRRRRMARARYVRIAQVPTGGYNTIVTNQSQTQYTHVQTPRYYQPPTAPMPPQYQQTEIPKQPPPPYQQ